MGVERRPNPMGVPAKSARNPPIDDGSMGTVRDRSQTLSSFPISGMMRSSGPRGQISFSLMVGRTISHYRITGQLGAGGMGVVYRAEDTRLGRPVALKFVSQDLTDDAQAIQRLRSEARAASALNHPHICTIYDIGEDEGRPFIVMELMTGRTLRERLLAGGALKAQQVLDVGIEVADALRVAHGSGIVHRDIKPGNIFLTDTGHVKILDFGLAKVTPTLLGSVTTAHSPDPTAAGVMLGTTAYMSPEQVTGEQLDPRSDLFSLGVVLYEAATGEHPFPVRLRLRLLGPFSNARPCRR